MGRRRDAAIRRRSSDASTTCNDTPSAAAVERVLWARRYREARPLAAPVAVPIVTGAAHRLSRSGWGSPLGHSLGRTRPYVAVSGPTPSTYGLGGSARFAGISWRGGPTNAMLHTREDA